MEKIDVDEIGYHIRSAFGDEFVLDSESGPISGLPLFNHVASGHHFCYIPAGQFLMGFSEREARAARAISDPIQANISEVHPVHAVCMSPFLMAERPVLTREISGEEADHPDSAAYVHYEEALAYCQKFEMALPKEAQWEYACRAGSSSLFTWGDYLPDDDELTGWMTFDFTASYGRANAFGLYGLFVGEWTADFFTESYDSDVEVDTETGARAVRGGGAFFWPWQDQEWVWCMCAMRFPSTDLPDNRVAFRFVRNL